VTRKVTAVENLACIPGLGAPASEPHTDARPRVAFPRSPVDGVMWARGLGGRAGTRRRWTHPAGRHPAEEQRCPRSGAAVGQRVPGAHGGASLARVRHLVSFIVFFYTHGV